MLSFAPLGARENDIVQCQELPALIGSAKIASHDGILLSGTQLKPKKCNESPPCLWYRWKAAPPNAGEVGTKGRPRRMDP